jgi:hypothetical protein
LSARIVALQADPPTAVALGERVQGRFDLPDVNLKDIRQMGELNGAAGDEEKTFNFRGEPQLRDVGNRRAIIFRAFGPGSVGDCVRHNPILQARADCSRC